MEATTGTNEIGREILNQLGNKALFMLGAVNIGLGHNYVSFKIRGSKKVTHIRIELNSLDTYDMTFYKVRGTDYKVVREYNQVYCDDLHRLIRQETGLNTSL